MAEGNVPENTGGLMKTTYGIIATLVVHPGSETFMCRVLSVRYPNIRFTSVAEKFGIIMAVPVQGGRLEQSMEAGINDAIGVLSIVWQLTGGAVGQYIHG